MSGIEDYTNEEWRVLQGAVEAAGLAVIAAQPGAAVRERQAMFEAWRASADMPFADNQLVRSLIRNRDVLGEAMKLQAEWEESLSGMAADQISARAIELCAAAKAILARKATPEERAGYRQWTLHLARQVAGVDSAGGAPVSAAEQAVLDQISAALT